MNANHISESAQCREFVSRRGDLSGLIYAGFALIVRDAPRWAKLVVSWLISHNNDLCRRHVECHCAIVFRILR